jgi:hypothetical protein
MRREELAAGIRHEAARLLCHRRRESVACRGGMAAAENREIELENGVSEESYFHNVSYHSISIFFQYERRRNTEEYNL